MCFGSCKYELCVFGSSELCVSVRTSMSCVSRLVCTLHWACSDRPASAVPLPGFGLAVTRCAPTALSNVVHVKGVGQHGREVRGLHGSGVARTRGSRFGRMAKLQGERLEAV